MNGIKNHVPHDEDEIIPVIVIPVEKWRELVEAVNKCRRDRSLSPSADAGLDEIYAIIAEVEAGHE